MSKKMTDLESEIYKIIKTCQSIIEMNKTMSKVENNSNNLYSPNQMVTDLALEKIADDMANLLAEFREKSAKNGSSNFVEYLGKIENNFVRSSSRRSQRVDAKPNNQGKSKNIKPATYSHKPPETPQKFAAKKESKPKVDKGNAKEVKKNNKNNKENLALQKNCCSSTSTLPKPGCKKSKTQTPSILVSKPPSRFSKNRSSNVSINSRASAKIQKMASNLSKGSTTNKLSLQIKTSFLCKKKPQAPLQQTVAPSSTKNKTSSVPKPSNSAIPNNSNKKSAVSKASPTPKPSYTMIPNNSTKKSGSKVASTLKSSYTTIPNNSTKKSSGSKAASTPKPSISAIQNNSAKKPSITNSNTVPNRSSTYSKLSSKIRLFLRSSSASTANTPKATSSISKQPSSLVCPNLYLDPVNQLKDEVARAMRNRKIFTIEGLHTPVRKALLSRGWIEKFHSKTLRLMDEIMRFKSLGFNDLVAMINNRNICETVKKLIKSRMIGDRAVDFYWAENSSIFRTTSAEVLKNMIINRFSSRIGCINKSLLGSSANEAFWLQVPGLCEINHPRSYLLTKDGDMQGFLKDFYLTAAISLLKWVVIIGETKQSRILSPAGKIPLKAFHFAINECYKFIKCCQHEDIDIQIAEASENEWNNFLEYYYLMVHIGNHFKEAPNVTETEIYEQAKFILRKINKYNPNLDMDGHMNIWIMKPVNFNQGQGIHICRTLAYILKTVKTNSKLRYIAQKYIEKPLLIYNTKFDIRQWFLITSANPLTIWMYKQCYLRFSSQTFNLRKLHESIHLTNNSIQKRYFNKANDIALPSYNMWDKKQFCAHLTNLGYPNVFDEIIYKGMKQAIVAAVLLHQESLTSEGKSFELFGADFILTEDFKPWMLEINSNPALHSSTPVTSRLCPRVLEDVIKVVIDYSKNKNANTGDFEMIYRQTSDQLRFNENANLHLVGRPLTRNYFWKDENNNDKQDVVYTEVLAEKSVSVTDLQEMEKEKNFTEITSNIKTTLKTLLQLVQLEKQRRQNVRNRSAEAVKIEPEQEKKNRTVKAS